MNTNQMIIYQYGKADLFKIESFILPSLDEGEILIDLFSTSINPVDINIRKGKFQIITGKDFPKTLGADFAGKVKKSKDPGFKTGDEVFGMLDVMKGGAYSERIIVTGNYCTHKPDHLTIYEAGVIPVTGMACFEALIVHGNIKKEHRVFINGCTGGVGSLAVMMAKAVGAEITGTCSELNFGTAEEIGTDEVIDYKKLEIKKLQSSFDIVFDTTGKLGWNQMKRFGNKSAKYATTGFKAGTILRSAVTKSLKIINVMPDSEKLVKLKKFLEEHMIKPLISTDWPFEDISYAHNEYETNRPVGKILIKIKEDK